jgi:hypothetical protein
MAQQSQLDVSKWQASRRQWLYTPVLWFYWRTVEAALLDVRCDAEGRPTDQALLARDWVARSERSEIRGQGSGKRRFVSFPECCEILGLNTEAERIALLDMIDKLGDFDSDEAWARLEALSNAPPMDDDEPLFDAPRVVPALDQMRMFA